jgi:hypothetical protein
VQRFKVSEEMHNLEVLLNAQFMVVNLIPEPIAKEAIGSLSFKQTGVVNNPVEIRRKLNTALVLGNSYKHKIKIVFDSDEGLKEVHTTVWAVSEGYVVLKGSIYIPVDAVLEVQLL